VSSIPFPFPFFSPHVENEQVADEYALFSRDNVAYTLTGNQTVANTGSGDPVSFEIVPSVITGVPDKM
jgi:hypothetical protein